MPQGTRVDRRSMKIRQSTWVSPNREMLIAPKDSSTASKQKANKTSVPESEDRMK